MVCDLFILLLARGRDRLETDQSVEVQLSCITFSYSLGDAIDWKQKAVNV